MRSSSLAALRGPWALLATLLACAHAPGDRLSTREQAQLLVQKGTPEKALPLLEDLHRRSPDDLDVARLLTEAHARAGRLEELIARLSSSAAGLSAPVRHYMLGLAYFAQAADATGPAVHELEQAIALAPENPEYHFRLGLAHLESEHYQAALPPLRRAAELAPTRPGLYLPLAKALARTGDGPGAVAALRSFVAQAPSPSEVATARALMSQISDPFIRFPKAAEARWEQGLAWLQAYDVPQQAIVAFEEILRDYPDLAVVHALLGLAYQRLDDAGRAVEEFKRAIELAPDSGRNHFYLGELYLSRQRPEPARAAFERAIALDPLLDEAYLRLGDLALERRDIQGATTHLRILTFLQPDAVAPRGKLALALQLAGDYPAAERELRRVLEKDAENVEFMLRLGLLNADRRNHASRPEERVRATEEAARWLRRVLELQPENAVASRALESLRGQ